MYTLPSAARGLKGHGNDGNICRLIYIINTIKSDPFVN